MTVAFTDGFAAARRGDLAAARASRAALGDVGREIDAALAAEPRDGDRIYGVRARILAMELEAAILAAESRFDDAVAILESASALEEELPFTFGPPFIDKPTRELLGDVLLEAGRPDEAADAYRAALARTPGRRWAADGLARAEGSARAGR